MTETTTPQDYSVKPALDIFDDIFEVERNSSQEPFIQDIKASVAALARAMDRYLIETNNTVPQMLYDRAITDLLAAQMMIVKCLVWK